MVICEVDVILVDYREGIGAVDGRVRVGAEVGCCGVLWVESEEFECGAGGGVVDYVEGLG